MMRFAKTLGGLVVASTAFGGAALPTESPRAVASRVMPTVVRIWIEETMLTGTIIGKDGLVVTCAHIPANVGQSVAVVTQDGRRYAAKVISKLPKPGERRSGKDIALVQMVGAKGLPVASIGRSDARELMAVGYPDTLLLGDNRSQDPAYVRLGTPVKRTYDKEPMELVTSIFGSGGDSGGPLFDLAGNLIGVCHAGETSGSYTRYTRIEALLAGWSKLTSKPRPALSTRRPPAGPALKASVPASIRSAVVEVRSQERWVGFGCVVGEGLIVTKASELGPELRVVLNDIDVALAEVAATDPSRDLALLRLSYAPELTKLIPKIKWSSLPDLPVATPVAVATPLEFTALTGISCYRARPVPPIAGIIPVVTKPAPNGVEITEITDSFFTYRLRRPFFPLRVGDVITQLEGIPVPDPAAFVKLAFEGKKIGKRPRVSGEPIEVTFLRNGKTLKQTVTLEFGATPSSQLVRASSLRYSAFASAIGTDIRIRPEHCGAPVVDDRGRVVGLMVGRAPFIEALILPASEVAKSLDTMLRSLGGR
ncbi:MAG: trypsin-like peptidase domain-containing protein [Fimbriimonas sp.]